MEQQGEPEVSPNLEVDVPTSVTVHSLCTGRYEVLKSFIPDGFTLADVEECSEEDFVGAVTESEYKLLMRVFFKTVLLMRMDGYHPYPAMAITTVDY